MKTRFVLDAWAIVALLQGEEPAALRVKELLSEAEKGSSALFMSIVNLGEIMYCVGKVNGEREAEDTLEQIRHLPLTIVPATDEAVLAAARFKIGHTVSYADAFAATTAQRLNGILVTGDAELLRLGNQIQIEELVRGEGRDQN